MKIKISWPTAIIIAIASFVVFILSFVFKVTFLPKYDHHLVSEEYYDEELNYQEEIDKLKNAAALDQDVYLEKTADGLSIVFPTNLNFQSIEGTIYFKRLSNNKIDFSLPIELASNILFIPNENLVDGRWDVKIDWQLDGESYLFKEKIIY